MRWLLVSLIALTTHVCAESPSSPLSTTELAKIGPAVEKLIAEKKLAGGSVLIMHRGQLVYQEEFGHRDLENQLPMEKDTLFRIFSMTKAITSATALMLCEEGKMSLDDPIHLHLPKLKDLSVYQSKKAKRAPTVRDLLRHTSGLGSSWGGELRELYRQHQVGDRKHSLTNTIEGLGQVPLLYQPGERWVYGLSSDVLAAVVASAAGEPFEKVIQNRLLTPLGMTDTFYHVPPEKADRLATGYRQSRDGLRVIKASHLLKDPVFKGGGSGLISTISDYARFLQMIANGGIYDGKRYLKADTVDLMRTDQLPLNIPCISFSKTDVRHGTGFGLGFSVRTAEDKRWDPHAPIGEYGWGGAASTHYWISPKHELLVVTMEQTMPYNWNLEHTLKPIIYGAFKK